MELRRQDVKVEILDPRRGFEPVVSKLEMRWDPLTGHTSRILPPSGLLPQSDFDLSALAEETEATCPFCSPRLETAVPKFAPELLPAGRVHQGEAVLFPNLLPYSGYSSVSVYSPQRHFLRLGDMTPRLVSDNLACQVAFDRAVLAHDAAARWTSINANHMLPSGSSVFHPHFQGGVHPTPTNLQRLLAETPPERFDDYLETERKLDERYLGEIGGAVWVASFAPVGPAELRAFVPGVGSPVELTADLIEDLGRGLAAGLNLYADLGFESFNMAVYGAPPATSGYMLNLRMVCRSNLEPLYRSDVAWLDRLHWEPNVDVSPEYLAVAAKRRFRDS